MRFAISSEAMNGSEVVLNSLDEILSRAEDDIHELEILGADLLEETAWYRSSRGDRQKMLEKLAESLVHLSPRARGPHLLRVEVNDEKTALYARAMAYSPLCVLVENRGSDGALVKAALKIFGSPAAWDLCFGRGALQTPRAFLIDSGGGHGELKKLMVKDLAEASSRGLEPRIIVVCDCDSEWVGDVKKHVSDIRADCAAKNVPCPPLNKRTAENYIPDAVWSAWAAELHHTDARQQAINVLLRLSPEQRDHVNLDKGDPWDSSKPDAVSLFAGVSPTVHALLKSANLKGSGPTMTIFSLETYTHALTHAEFRSRDHAGELEAIVRCIEDGL